MLAQLRSFLVVIEETSLNRAASRLRMSQPALSRQIQSLESEIGGALFERTPSGVRGTDAGFALARKIRPVLNAYDTAMSEVRKLAKGEKDFLRIGYLASATREYLNPALQNLKRTHPAIKVKLLNLSPGEQMACLRKGELDIALIGQEGHVLEREFYLKKLATFPTLAFLPDDHPLALKKKIRLSQLKNESWIGALAADMPGYNRWLVQICRNSGFRPRIGCEAKSLAHAFELIVNEHAIGIFPSYMKKQSAPGISIVPIQESDASWDFLVAWQRGKTSGATRAFLDGLLPTKPVRTRRLKKSESS